MFAMTVVWHNGVPVAFFTWHMHFIIIMKLACFQECVLPMWVSFATSYRILLCGSGFQQKRKEKLPSARTKVEKLALRELCVDHWANWSEGGSGSLSGNWPSHCWCLNAACQPWGAHYWLCCNLLEGVRPFCKQEKRNFWRVRMKRLPG